MDGVRSLVAAARLSRRRAMKPRDPRSGDMMLYAWLVVVVVIRFTQNCLLAARELGHGNQDVGMTLTSFCMLHCILAVFLIAFLSSLLSFGASSLDRRRLALTGVRFLPLAGAELAALGTHPLTGVLFLFTLPAAVPLCMLPHAAASVLSLLACFAAVLLISAGLAHAVSLSRAGRAASGAFRLLFVTGLFGLVLANFDFDWKEGPVRLFVFQHPLLLADPGGGGLISGIGVGSPSEWIVSGRLAASVLLALAGLCVYAACIHGVYAKAGETEPLRRGRTRRAVHGGSLGSLLFRQELARLASSPGALTGALAGLGSAAWLLLTRHPTVAIPVLGAAVAVFATFSFPVNVFGWDGTGLRRYALLHPDWAAIFKAKNGAWLAVAGVSAVAPAAAAGIRVGAAQAASLLLSAAAASAVSVLWGNISSLLLPSAAAGSRTGARPDAAFINQAAPFLICALIFGVHGTVGPFGSAAFDGAMLACLAAAAALYAVFLRRLARTFDAEVQDVLERF